MGRCKHLLPLGDRPVISRFLEALQKGGAEEIVLVLSPRGAEIREAIRDLPVTVVWNLDPEADMASSLRIGLKSLPADCEGILTGPGDLPLLTSGTVSLLIERFRGDLGRIIQPVFRGKKGHPLLFPRAVLEELHDLPTLREVIGRDPGRVVRIPVEDTGVVSDIDTPEDYERAKKMWRWRSGL